MKSSLPAIQLAIVAPMPSTQIGIAHLINERLPNVHHVATAVSLEQLRMQCRPRALSHLAVVLEGAPETIAEDAERLLRLSKNNSRLHILVFTYCRDHALLAQLKAKPRISIIARQESQDQACLAIAQALTGSKTCSPYIESLLQSASPNPAQATVLSRTERSVMTYLVQGLSVSDIALMLHRSTKTISTHKCNSMRKLGMCSNSELFRHLQGQLTNLEARVS